MSSVMLHGAHEDTQGAATATSIPLLLVAAYVCRIEHETYKLFSLQMSLSTILHFLFINLTRNNGSQFVSNPTGLNTHCIRLCAIEPGKPSNECKK